MSSNRKILRNTVMLYIRMICSVCINLYAARKLLQILGVDDFGVYNIVGGIVALLSFLNSSMSGCTSRFLTYELGREDKSKLRTTFSAAFNVHIFISLVILLIGETLGLWFVNAQLVIPEARMTAANIVYQFSLFSAVISFLQVPYSADIIANERMDAYAFIEILHALLKLSVIILLAYLSFDKLVAYSALIFCVSVAVFLSYRLFCKRHFEEAFFKPGADRSVLIPMLRFTGWDIYGNLCVIVQQQGVNVLINRFFGVALNAATGVAIQASSAVSMFVSSFTMALRPPLIKKYASGDIQGLQRLLTISLILCTFLAELICLPLYLRIDTLMELWLVNVPAYAVLFCKWLLLSNAVIIVNTLFNAVIHATGRIKGLSLVSGSLYLLTVLFSYIALRLSQPPQMTYTIGFIISVIVLLNNIIITKRLIPTMSFIQISRELLVPAIALMITVFTSLYINSILPDNLLGIVLLFVINALIAFSILYFLWSGPKYGWNLKKYIWRNEI